MTSLSVTSRNDEVCSLQDTIHENINYSDLSRTQARALYCEIDSMKTWIKFISHVILEYFHKYKATKEVSPEMNIITTSSKNK